MGSEEERQLVGRFREEGSRSDRVRIEGFHALKHALRFGGEVELAVTSDPAEVERLAGDLAPDVWTALQGLIAEVGEDSYRLLGPYAHHTHVAALARRPPFDLAGLLARREAPIVLLEDPRHLGNLGAVVRVAAAAGAAGVLTSGGQDPWDPVAIRGSGGLHFAVPVGRIESLDELSAAGRPLLALDPGGDPLRPTELPPDALLAFGSERHGLSDALLARADRRISIPMRPGVSSLNLATSVSAVLFAWRLSGA